MLIVVSEVFTFTTCVVIVRFFSLFLWGFRCLFLVALWLASYFGASKLDFLVGFRSYGCFCHYASLTAMVWGLEFSWTSLLKEIFVSASLEVEFVALLDMLILVGMLVPLVVGLLMNFKSVLDSHILNHLFLMGLKEKFLL